MKEHWNSLIVDTAATPLPLSDERFREWMSRQRVFVSSVMDAELTPYREAARAYLRGHGASPMMWEDIAPQDIAPECAFLDGVDRSTHFVLVLGSRYGVQDSTGYSPTHKEANRAKERHIARHLFTLSNATRTGPLNDWLRSLHNEIAGLDVATTDAFSVALDTRLRELAARAERNWIKLGSIIFPGKVKTEMSSQDGKKFTVIARPTSNAVRNAIFNLTRSSHGRSSMRLTWPNRSFSVEVDAVKADSEYTGSEEIEIVCSDARNAYGDGGRGLTDVSIGGRDPMGPADIALVWVRRAIFGEGRKKTNSYDMLDSHTTPDAPTLPEVLRSVSASGWLAEGIVRLYAVEEVARYQGGEFTRLDVGASTATSIQIDGEFEAATQLAASRYAVAVSGTIALSP